MPHHHCAENQQKIGQGVSGKEVFFVFVKLPFLFFEIQLNIYVMGNYIRVACPPPAFIFDDA